MPKKKETTAPEPEAAGVVARGRGDASSNPLRREGVAFCVLLVACEQLVCKQRRA